MNKRGLIQKPMPFRKSRIVKIVSFLLCFSLICQQAGFAQVLPLIQPPALSTPLLRYISVNSSNPFHYFNFLMAKDSPLLGKEGSGEILGINQEAKKLVNYFLLGISLPSEDFWVNLNPQESDSVTSDKLANTDLGRVLLEQDLMLKRDAAKYLHPQNSVGKVFWTRLYQGIEENQGDGSVDSGVRQTKSTEPSPNFTRQSSNLKKLKITANTRVWIVPAKTVVLETGSGAFVAEAKLKVLSENEYLKVTSHKSQVTSDASLRGAAVGGDEAILSQNKNDDNIQILSEQLIRQIILPALTKDVNESPAYAPLRQIYSSLILAEWYKKKHGKSDSSVLPFEKGGSGGISPYAPYINSGNITGLESEAPWQKDKYYQEYLKSYTQGEYNIRDTIFNIKRMYFSGGIALFGANAKLNGALPIITTHSPAELLQQGIDFSAVKKRFSSALVGIQAGANGVKPEKIEVVALNSEATPDSAASSVISKGKLVTAFTSLSLLSDWIYSNLASATEVFTKNGVLEKISFEAGKGNTLGHLGLKLKGLGDALPSSLSFLNEGSIWTGGRLEKLRLTLQDLPGGSKIFGNNIDKVFPGSFGDVSGLGITQKIQQTVNTAATILPKFNEPLGVYPDDLSSLPNLSPSTDPGTLENIWQWFSANQYYQQEILIGLAIFGAAGLAWKLYQKNKKADQGQAEAPIASSLYEKMVNPFKNMLSAFFEKLKGEKKVESKEEEAKPVIETNSENPVVSTEEENPLQVDKLSEVTEGDGAEQPVQSVEDEGVPSEEVVQGYKQEEGSPVELKEIKETDERYEEEFKRFEHQEALQESLETPLVIPKLPTATPKTVKKLFEKLLDAKSQSEIEKLRVFILKEVGNAKGINNTQKEAILQVVEILIGKVVLRLEAIASGIKTKKQEQKEADLRKTAVDASADFELALTLDELIQLHTAIKTQVNDSLQKGNIDEATHSRLIGLLKEAFQKAEEQLKKENEQVKAEEKAGVEKSADVTMPAAQPEQSGQAKEEAPQAQNKRHLRDKVKARIDNLLNLTAVNKLEKEALVIELFINDEASVFSAEQREILLKRLHSIYDKAKQQLERKPVDSSELNQMQYAFKEAFRKKTEKEIKSLVSVVDDNERGQKAEEIRKKITESVLLDNSEKSGLLSALDAVKPKSPENQGDGSVDFGASQIKSTEPSPSFKPADTEKPESKAVEVKAQETVVSQVTDKSGAVVEFGKPGYRFTDKEASDAYYKKGGWKLHLTVKPENYKAVDRWLFANHKGSYKLLQGGDSGEKDFTIYIGDRRASEAFAKKMESEIGNILEKSNAGSVDRLFTEKVAGRFDIQRTELGNKLGFIYYGGNGIPFDMRVIELVHQVMWSKSETDKSKIKANINTRRQLIENALEKEYGEYFTGIKTKDEKTESLIESKPAEVILAAKDENQGDGSVDFGVKPIKSTEPSPSFKPADTEKPESKPVEASQESVLPQSAEIEPEMGVGNLVKTNPELQSLIKIKKELSELFSDKKMGKISGEEYKNKQKELIEKKNLILKKLAEGYDAMVSDYYKRLDETLAALRMAGVSEEEINAKYLPILKAERGQFEYIEMEEIKLIDQKESPTIKGENQGNVSPDEATIEIAAEHKGVVKVDAAGKDLKLEQIKELVGSEKVAIEEIIQKINLLKEYKDTDYFSKFELSLKNILPAGWKIKNLMFDAPHNPENWYLLGLLHPSGKFMLGIPRRCFNYDGFDRYFDNQEKTISRGLRISQFIKPAIIVEESGGKFFALEKGLVSASSAITEKRGGIDFSNIEIAIKDEGYVSSLNAVDRKILLAASALKIDEWTDLAFVYLYEAKQLMEDRIVNTAVNTKLLSEVMDLLRNTTSLSPQATQALQFSKP